MIGRSSTDQPEPRWKKVENIFHEALGQSKNERRRFVEDRTKDDLTLRTEAIALIDAHECDSSIFESAAFEKVRPPQQRYPDDQDQQIGRYRLDRVIGRGGMGIVYAAEQDYPRRQVALKVMRAADWQDMRRLKLFDREIHTLGRLQDSRIADIYEAGKTKDGRPFFAMELISGHSLSEYVSNFRPSLSIRLSIFLKICEALIHAHQRGVIHGDLKPNNIMVVADNKDAPSDATPNIKVLDFGLSRLIDDDMSLTATEVGHFMGTLAYMSPEQFRWNSKKDVDVRSDVFTLGVIFFELLSGQRPFGQCDALPHQLVRAICETSARKLGTINRRLQGDLETIATKALEKDLTRRYQSVFEFASDIRRFTQNAPIIARRASAWYVSGRFVKRNKLLVSSLSMTAVAHVLGTVVSVWQALDARQANALAQQRLAETRQAVTFLENMIETAEPDVVGRHIKIALSSAFNDEPNEVLEDLINQINPTEIGREVLFESVLRPGYETIEQFADQPLIQSQLLAQLGRTFVRIGDYRRADPTLSKAYELMREQLGEESSDVLITQGELANLYHQQARWEEAEDLFSKVFEIQSRVLGVNHRSTLQTRSRLALLHLDQNRFDVAQEILEETLDSQEQFLGADDIDTQNTLHSLALLFQSRGQYSESENLYVQMLAQLREQHGEESIVGLKVATSLGSQYRAQRRLEEAEQTIAKTLEIQTRTLGETHPDTLISMKGFAELKHYQGDYELAEKMYLRVIEAQENGLGTDHPDTIATKTNLAMVYSDQGRFSESELLFQSVIDVSRLVLGLAHTHTLSAIENMALSYGQQREYANAIELLQATIDPLRGTLGESHPRTALVTHRLAGLYDHAGRFAEAQELLLRLRMNERKTLGWLDFQTLSTSNSLGRSYLAENDFNAAYDEFEYALISLSQVYGENDPRVVESLSGLGATLLGLGHYSQAENVLAKGVSIAREAYMHEDTRVGEILSVYGACLTNLRRFRQSESILLEAHEILKNVRGPGHELTVEVIHQLVKLYSLNSEDAKTDLWSSQLEKALELGPPNSTEQLD